MRKFILSVLLFFVISGRALAVDADDFGMSEVEQAVPEQAREVLGEMEGRNADANGIIERIAGFVSDNAMREAKNVLKPVLGVIVISLLCCVAESGELKNRISYVQLGGCLAIAVLTVGDVNTVMAMGQAAIEDISDFSRVLMPTLSTVAASAGAVSSAGVKYAATTMFLDVLIAAVQKLILPLVGVFTIASVACAALGDGRLELVVKMTKWASKMALTALVVVFTAYLSIVGIAASGTDAAVTKAAKTVISNMIPVVGKLVSDASESLVAGAGVIRNTLGIFGLGAVAAVCAMPFLRIGLRYLLFKAASAVVGAIAGEKIGRLVENISTAYGMVLACVGTGAIFMFISVLSMIRTVI